MANLIPIEAQHFDAFRHNEDLCYAVQLLLYRQRFQEGVLMLRRKYGLLEHRGTAPSVIKSQQIIDDRLEEINPNEKLENDIALLLREMGQMYNDEARWLAFTLLFVTQNMIAAPLLIRSWKTWRDDGFEQGIQEMQEAYKKADALLARGKDGEAEDVLFETDRVVYQSPKVKITVRHREIVLALSPHISKKNELEPLLTPIMKLAKLLRDRQVGKEVGLDVLNEIATLRRARKNDNAIANALRRYGSFSSPQVRKLCERAKKLGF